MNKNLLKLKKFEPESEDILGEITEGLSRPQKELPSKLFYDQRGSSLFEEITKLEEYYPTRTEVSIMNGNIGQISDTLGEGCLLIELGSGSSRKIRLLLENLKNPAGYVPIDISEEHLLESAKTLANDYPGLRIMPVYADYTKSFNVPPFNFPYSKIVVYYPGSTIGNFKPGEARGFLKRISRIAGPGSGLLIGVDLVKDHDILHKAYNDRRGVTAEFNLNMLRRINREVGADFDLDMWEHSAFYNPGEKRIEMHLESKGDQLVQVDGMEVRIEKGESILTEYSHKYTLSSFREIVSDYYGVDSVWTDPESLFSIQYLIAK